jgi:hypothetical protein
MTMAEEEVSQGGFHAQFGPEDQVVVEVICHFYLRKHGPPEPEKYRSRCPTKSIWQCIRFYLKEALQPCIIGCPSPLC